MVGPSATEEGGATTQLLRRFGVPEGQQRIFQSHAAALAEARDGNGVGIVPLGPTANVESMLVTLNGSAGIDNVVITCGASSTTTSSRHEPPSSASRCAHRTVTVSGRSACPTMRWRRRRAGPNGRRASSG